jgi:hypothetical protein
MVRSFLLTVDILASSANILRTPRIENVRNLRKLGVDTTREYLFTSALEDLETNWDERIDPASVTAILDS